MSDPVWGLTSDQWNVLNVAGTWVSGMATATATWVALHIANRSLKQRADVEIAAAMMFGPGLDVDDDYMRFSIVNTGERKIIIDQLGWQIGWFKKAYAYQSLYPVPGNSSLPITLEHGDSAQWFLPLGRSTTDPNCWERHFAKQMLLGYGTIGLRSLRAVFRTSIGTSFKAKPQPSIMGRLRQALRWEQMREQ